jgi:hypothetical protein
MHWDGNGRFAPVQLGQSQVLRRWQRRSQLKSMLLIPTQFPPILTTGKILDSFF